MRLARRLDSKKLTPAAALIHVLKSRAVRQCKEEQRAYYECVKGRTLSVVRRWPTLLFGRLLPRTPRCTSRFSLRCSASSALCAHTHVLSPLPLGLGLPSKRGRDEHLLAVRSPTAALSRL